MLPRGKVYGALCFTSIQIPTTIELHRLCQSNLVQNCDVVGASQTVVMDGCIDNHSAAEHVRTLCDDGRLKEALCILNLMEQHGSRVSFNTFVCLLKTCDNLEQGKQIHDHVVKTGIKLNIFLGNLLVNMYAKCGSLVDAHHLFVSMSTRDVYTWSMLIAAYTKCGHNEEALKLFGKMEHEGVKPNNITFLSVLKACISLKQGRKIHACIIQGCFDGDVFMGSTLIDMYAKCGSIEDACRVFKKVPKHNVVSWNTIIAGYVQHGLFKQAFALIWQMQEENLKPDEITFLSTLKACVGLGCLEHGKHIHAYIIQTGIEINTSVANSLVNMYTKCESMGDAWHVFNKIPKQDAVSWTAMIFGYVRQGHAEEALHLMDTMREGGTKPNKVTYISVLNACASLASLEKGLQIHRDIVQNRWESDIFVESALIDMYSKCGIVEDACNVFYQNPQRDVVTWNTMIIGYTLSGHSEEALQLFWQMQCEGMKLDEATCVSTLKACANLVTVEQGKQVHDHIIKIGFDSAVLVGSTLIELYVKCCCMIDARWVFNTMDQPPMFVWTAMIAAYIQTGGHKEALQLIERLQFEKVILNDVSFISILKASASKAALEEGMQIHALIIQAKIETNIWVGNSLIDMYAKCGSVYDAYQVLDRMSERDVVSFNAMIFGYVQNGLYEEAINFFWQMQDDGVRPDRITFVSVLKACTSLAALEQGRRILALAVEDGLDTDDVVRGVLVDLYAKCGRITEARRVFNGMLKPDSVSCTAMISGYAQHGLGKEALQLFEEMKLVGVKLDHITFIGVLSACSHAGLVDEGLGCFDSMYQDHGIAPISDHYACVVDLLGRAGRLDDAVGVLNKMPFQPTAILWTALLGACRNCGNVDLAKHSVERILALEPQNATASVLLSNIYAANFS